MSILFGLLKPHQARVAELELWDLGAVTERYATARGAVYLRGRLGMGLQPYASHLRSELEQGPVPSPHGHVLCFDGRLDNYKELSEDLGLDHPTTYSDSQIVLAAFARWKEACFSRFVGDWALALWSEANRSLYLARDHAGTRTLYLRFEQGEAVWSTYLDTFRTKESELRLSQDYAACYLGGRFVGDLTPYEGIRSVPPAHYVRICDGVLSQHQHWNSTIEGTIRYPTDAEYEAHFLTLFRQSVARRTGHGAPILAQLSGGMDSTAIVCTSDRIRREESADSEILDTVSFYDDSESSLNERPYFSITEAKRGKVGIHLDISFSQRTFMPHHDREGVYLLPGADSFSIEQERRFAEAVWCKGYRSVLSGIGGDEVLGGIPNPLPELAGYLVSANLPKLLQQSLAWSLIDRSPLFETLWRTAAYTGHLYLKQKPNEEDLPPWIAAPLRKRSREIGSVNAEMRSRRGIPPHRIDNSLAWSSMLETLPHLFPQLLVRPDYRYPFLDKDLVKYLFSIPRNQILRPGRRRSLMRRALANIVPDEILERRRKAYQLRAPLHALKQAHEILDKLFASSMLDDAGLIDVTKLRHSLRRTAEGDPAWWQATLKTISLELWLRSVTQGRLRPESSGLRLTA